MNPIAFSKPRALPAGDKPPHWAITFAVDDADAAAERAADLGGKVLTPPQDLPYVRMAVLSDPQGAAFTVSKYVPENGWLGGRQWCACRPMSVVAAAPSARSVLIMPCASRSGGGRISRGR